MKLNSLLGLAAVAGAAYFLKSEKGINIINQHRGQFDNWMTKGEQALKDDTDRFNNTSINNPV